MGHQIIKQPNGNYCVWSEGFSATGNSAKAQLFGKYKAKSFTEAVNMWGGSDEGRKKHINDSYTAYWGCRLLITNGMLEKILDKVA